MEEIDFKELLRKFMMLVDSESPGNHVNAIMWSHIEFTQAEMEVLEEMARQNNQNEGV